MTPTATLLWLSLTSLAPASPPSPTDLSSAHRLVSLVDYLSSDYALAVDDGGRVLSDAEYAEQRSLAAEARLVAAGLDPAVGQRLVSRRLSIANCGRLLRLTRVADQLFQAVQAAGDLFHRGAEGETDVAVEARQARGAAAAGVDVEEDSRHRDHLPLQGGAEEGHAVVERRRQVGERGEQVEGPLGLAVDAEPQGARAGEHQLALG